MSFVRTLIAALLFLAWMPATNSCLVAAAFPEKISDSCPDEGDAAGSTCDKCAALENGFQLSLLQPITLDAPAFAEIAWLSAMLRAAMREVSVEPLPTAITESPPARQLWTFVARTALPVRGPSLAA